ncbi:CDP-glycerol glycerophosphotransferase family protein [Vibrio lentus]|uniref:CDP-glycerol glycerophosphotransferase family protein n=1 Tax=Vibrio lentus TaxID=136468 RepID=UPI000C8645E8|nr:CDP-glycerol glycerophosphotransferase family protein [Vibrio lentus]PMI86553.1 hypothetical protein BCU35_14735 [Vibrio lentus]
MKIIKKFMLWILNVALILVRNPFRNKNQWIFGAWKGELYADNSKAFFEYVVNNHKNIDAIWITNNKLIKDKLLKEGKKVYLSYEFRGIKSRLTSGKLFYTNGIDDVGDINLSSGSEIIALWHGVPLKKLMYAQDLFKNNSIKKSYNKIYSNTKRTKTISTSDLVSKFFIESYEIKNSSIILSGQPRNDTLFDSRLHGEKIKSISEVDINILLMPTWRQFGFDPYIEELLSLLSKDTVLLNVLEEQSIRIILKLHPRVKTTLPPELNEHILIITEEHDFDVQELMVYSDCLITDYSSVFIDYSLMNKPIYFYTPDMDDYIRNNHELFLEFDVFTTNTIKEFSLLRDVLIDLEKNKISGLENTKKIRQTFHDSNLQNGGYCENLFRLIKS